MLLIDADQGLFAYIQTRPPDVEAWLDGAMADDEVPSPPTAKPGTLLVQAWAPIDYYTAPFGWGEIGEKSAVLMAWVLDDEGRAEELGLGVDDYEASSVAVNEVFADPNAGEVDWRDDDLETYDFIQAERGLVLVSRLPAHVPRAISEALEQRQQQRLLAVDAVVSEVNEALTEGAFLWLVLFGGSQIAGIPKETAAEGTEIILEKAYPQPARKKKQQRVPLREIAAARKFTGKWKAKEGLGSPMFSSFREKVDRRAVTLPQLWGAGCPVCGMAVRLPWVSRSCRSCADGEIRTPFSVLTDDRLEGLLEGRAEWAGLTVEISETSGRWRAAFRSPSGSLVQSAFPGEPMISERETRREVLIALNQLSQEHGFTVNPDFEGRVEWEEIRSTAGGLA